MITAKRLWLFATAAALAGAGLSAAVAQPEGGDVRAGIDAWAGRIMTARSGSGARSPTAAMPTRNIISPRPISSAAACR